jgi:hypothetical protein
MRAAAFAAALLGAAALAGCSTTGGHHDAPAVASSTSSAPATPHDCPVGVAPGTRCLAGIDEAGAFYWIAVPPQWNHMLVLHAHGGPALGKPTTERPRKDLERWAVWTRAGFAWAGSSFHQGGVAVHAAAEDTERLRHIFTATIGQPTRTILHGQSWGAGVAAVEATVYTAHDAAGRPPYDAVLLTSGVLGGGTQSYDFRLDLRVVYQAVCGNHPRPDEPQYPLWQGLPPGSTLTRAELKKRVDECTGIAHPAAQRSAQQKAHLKTLLDVIRIPERTLYSHIQWGTFHFQELVFHRLGGRNPFSNDGVRYSGSPDDAALNAKVARYRADPAAVAAFAADADPNGRIPVPVLTVHAVDDPTAFVELESAYREVADRAGAGGRLVQTFTDNHDHSYLADAEYVAAIESLLGWVERGEKPTPASVAARCAQVDAAFDPAKGCRFLPDYHPAPLAQRVPARVK